MNIMPTVLYADYPDHWIQHTQKYVDFVNCCMDKILETISFPAESESKENKYFKTLNEAILNGIEKKPLKIKLLIEWKNEITNKLRKQSENSNISEVNLEKINQLIKDINTKLLSSKKISDSQIVELISDIIFECEKEDLFYPVERQMTFLILGYLVSYFDKPLILFKLEDKDVFLASIHNRFKIRMLLANRIREAIFHQGLLLDKVRGSNWTDYYRHPLSTKKIDLAIEWHNLRRDAQEWERKAQEV